MDFRSLIDKLEKINQQQLLQESTHTADQFLSEDLEILKEAYIALMEKLNYKVMRQAAGISDEIERRQFLGTQARKNGYPGLFDPVTGKFVNSDGEYAWFGAYKSEVEQMERDGLIPEKARTEALLGLMGKDYDTAYKSSKKVADKDEAIDTANEIMAKGKQSYKPLDLGVTKTEIKEAKRGTLAKSITESFGYTFKELVESITKEEHRKLKDIVNQLKDQKDDVEVAKMLSTYDEYVKIRNVIISKIESILTELQKLRAQPITESRQMLREEIYLFGDETTREISALTLYYDSNDNLVEYSIRQGLDDLSDVGRGTGQALTFGYSDNAIAGIKSLFKGTRYADELKKELIATQQAKERSPYLYGAGYALGMAPYFMSGWGVAAVGVAGTAADYFHRQDHNTNTLLNREKELAAQGGNGNGQTNNQTGSGQKPRPNAGGKIPYSAEVEKLQQMILKKDPNALPKYGADGRLGSETLGAAQRLGIKLPSNVQAPATATVSTQIDPNVAKEIMDKLGAKDPASAKAAFEKLVATHGGNTAEAIGALISGSKPVVKESIIFSSMTEAEHLAYLRNRLVENETQILLEWGALGRAALEALALNAGRGVEAAMAALKVAIPNIGSAGIKIGGETWRPIAGATGKFSNGKGAMMEADQILHFITNTSTVGDTVMVAGKAYNKTATGWAEVGKAKVLPRSMQEQLEKAWAKANGKDPHAPVPRPGPGPTPPGPTPPGPHPAPAPAPVPPGPPMPSPTNPSAFRQWISTRYPRLTNAVDRIIKVGAVPARFIKNHKWWAALAALTAWGYIWPGITDGPEPNPNPNPNDPNNPHGPGPKPEESDQKVDDKKKKEEERKRKEAEYFSQLEGLVKMLQDMFPDDKETADIIAKVNSSKGTSGSDQKVDDKKKKLSQPGWDPNWKPTVGGGQLN